jgi:hypothetical protein
VSVLTDLVLPQLLHFHLYIYRDKFGRIGVVKPNRYALEIILSSPKLIIVGTETDISGRPLGDS